jgi:hypothetical protein
LLLYPQIPKTSCAEIKVFMQPIFLGHPVVSTPESPFQRLGRYPAQAIAAGGLKYTVSLALRHFRRHEKLTPSRRRVLTPPEGGGSASDGKEDKALRWGTIRTGSAAKR